MTKTRQIRQSASSRAGIIFPAARFSRLLKKMPQKVHRVSKGAGVYMASVVEYLIAELIELSGNACRDNKRSRISPRDILLAIGYDLELAKLLKHIIIPGSGVLPTFMNIDPNSGKAKTPAAKPLSKVAVKRARAQPAAPKAAFLPVNILAKKESVSKKGTSKSVTTLNERTLTSGQKITVIQADITNVAVDSIVHPTNNAFYLGGQVGHAISAAGGDKIRKLTADLHRTHGNLASCRVAICDASDTMLCKHVIHVHSPSWSTNQQAACIADLTNSVNNILTLSETHKLKTVALPSISSGGNGFPKQLAAQTILRAINAYFKALPTKASLEQVYFVLYDAESVGIYTSELGKLDI